MRSCPLRYFFANSSSSGRRSANGCPVEEFAVRIRPAGRTRSATPEFPSTSLVMRLAAGWMRWSRSSKEKLPLRGTTISPSSTKRLRLDSADGFDELGEIARQRLAGFRLQLDLVAVAEDEAAEAVPFRLVLPFVAGGNLVHRFGFHGHEGLTQREHDCLTQTAGISPAVQSILCCRREVTPQQ